MEKDRSFRAIAIVALIVAVSGLTLGFAAFTQNLNIQSGATVKAGDSTTFTDYIGYTGTPSCTGLADGDYTAGSLSGGTDTYKTTWSGITATLANPGDKLTCTATITNASQYIAYLKSISTASNALITCSGDASNVNDVCSNIEVKVDVAGAYATLTSTALSALTGTNSIAATTGSATVTFSVEYKGTAVPESDVTVTIPDFTLNYSTAA